MTHEKNNIDWKKYLIVFLITIGLFLTAGYLSNHFSDQRIDRLKSIQDDIAINILSSETQFALLSDLLCKDVSGSVLSGEIQELGQKIEWGQENLGNEEDLAYLKKYHSLLQIKDYLLMKQISEECQIKSAFILYFYTTEENCSECTRQSLVLSNLRVKYPELRVYSFDYNTDLSAVRAMLQIYGIEDTKLPALVVDEDLLTGFHSVVELDTMVQESFKLQEAESLDADDSLETKE